MSRHLLGAIVNKVLSRHGRDTFATPADMAQAIFGDSARVSTALRTIVALVLIAAITATLAGAFRTMRGDRGGAALTLSGIYGLVGLMAAMTVVL